MTSCTWALGRGLLRRAVCGLGRSGDQMSQVGVSDTAPVDNDPLLSEYSPRDTLVPRSWTVSG